MPNAFQSQVYDSRQTTGRMSDLMRETGAIQANATAQRGQVWGSTVGRMADLAGEAVVAYGKAKEAQTAQADADKVKAEQARIKQTLRESIDPTTGRIDYQRAAREIGQIDPVQAEQFWAKADDQQRQQAEQEAKEAAEVSRGLAGVLMAGDQDAKKGPGALQTAPRTYAAWREDAIKRGLVKPEDFPEEYDEELVQQQAVLKYMPAQALYEKLFAAKNAPKTTVLAPGAQMRDETGRLIAENPRPETPARTGTHVVDGHLVDDTGKVLYTSPTAGERRTSGGTGTRDANTLRDDMRQAEQWKVGQLSALEAAYSKGDISYDELKSRKAMVQESYLVQIGAPAEAPRRPETRNAGGPAEPTMRDLFDAPPAAPSSPLGSGTANAAPARRSAPKAGDIVSVKGQRVKITKMYPDGTFDAEPVK